jgi:CheY-like chemotaxis protein
LDIDAEVERTVRMFGRTRKDLVIHHEGTPGLPAVLADAAQLEQVLLNLLLNAGQAMPEGGELWIRTAACTLDAAEAGGHEVPPGQYLAIAIRDRGVGMDAATRQRIFEPFFTTRPAGQGTGLGLASVYGIVRNHGGFVTVDSEPGCGSTFTVHLPAAAVPARKTPAAVPSPHGGSGTILLVDDEDQILRTCSQMLEHLGYRVVVARSGPEAQEALRRLGPEVSLVILDMVMPGMSGRQTFEALREIAPEVRVLLSSGYSVEGQASEIMQRGCNGFIQKPFSLRDLAARVREALA